VEEDMKKEEFFRDKIENSKGPLEGIRILEATHTQAGPFAGKVLVDLGAESIKIDQPGFGEIGHYIYPIKQGPNGQESYFYNAFNAGKRCITLDMKRPEGQEIFRDLARHMDAIIQNFKAGTLDKWNCGYEDVRKVKPDIIYVSIAGFGQFGPKHTRPSYDAVGQASGGLMSVTGDPDGPPTRAGSGLADNLSGLNAVIGFLAALHYRNKTDRGQHIDVSQQDTVIYTTSDFGFGMIRDGFKWPRMRDSAHPGASPYKLFKTKDGEYVFLAVGLDSHWKKLCKAMGREDLIDDSRSKDNPSRAMNRDFVDQQVQEFISGYSYHELEEVFNQIPGPELVITKVYDHAQLLEDDHPKERDMVLEVEHPKAGKITLNGVSPKFSLTSTSIKGPAPWMGQHNEEIYMDLLGYSGERLNWLQEKGVI
jgi:crotonobetainyl-CoA:carnitine CoA-transferase CaiB-like acyl-CoA transferase